MEAFAEIYQIFLDGFNCLSGNKVRKEHKRADPYNIPHVLLPVLTKERLFSKKLIASLIIEIGNQSSINIYVSPFAHAKSKVFSNTLLVHCRR